MRVNFDNTYAPFAANVGFPWTGMIPYLAESLGVSEPTLNALGIGFAPVVQFKKRASSNWWVIPERNAEAKIVGLSLRADGTGAKVMYPCSKHGLIYAVRSGYETGTRNYTPGRHNWVRTMDAGRICPICGKPDGCLLSADNPADPKAVLCIREKKGATRPGNVDTGGWLHIRHADGVVSSGGPLSHSDYPVLIVEGMSDTAAAMDMGFVAVGRPSNMAGLGYLRELVRGRKCIVIGENDLKSDGRWPGKEGMEAVFETCKNTSQVVKILPPEGFKDLREWKNSAALTAEALLEYAEINGSTACDTRNLASKEPVRIAMRWIKEEHTQDGIPILRKYAREWYRFTGQAYEKLDEEAFIRGGLYRWLLDRLYMEEGPDGGTTLHPYEADKSKISNIIDALSMDCPLQAEPPCWLDQRTDPPPHHLIAFPNGVLDVYSHIRGEVNELLPLSPLFFTFNALPYNFDSTATCPLWENFLREIFPDDPLKIRLLQEWMGYLLLPDTTEQKLMVFNGPSGSGKSTVLHVIAAMLGSNQVCHPSLTGIGQEFGLAQFVGKLAAFVGDAHLDVFSKKQVIMERVKELTGSVRPKLMVRRMHMAEEAMHLFARLTIACNDLPDLPDSGGALPRRTLALHFTEKFETESRTPNRQLPDQLAAEAPGIFNWALPGLERLKRVGGFTIPKSSEELAKKFASNASPISQFINNCCDVGSQYAVAEEMLFEMWRNFSREHGLSSGMKLKFAHNLMLNVSSVRHIVDTKDGKQIGGFTGIAPTKEAKEKYLIR